MQCTKTGLNLHRFFLMIPCLLYFILALLALSPPPVRGCYVNTELAKVLGLAAPLTLLTPKSNVLSLDVAILQAQLKSLGPLGVLRLSHRLGVGHGYRRAG